MWCVALEKENDQQDDHDQQENATTDVHLQPPWSQVPRLVTRYARLKTGPWVRIPPRRPTGQEHTAVRRTIFVAIPKA
jgi:hypothetical protein